jgi:hypothetical protein
VAANGGKKPRLNPLARPGPEIPRAEPGKLRTGAEKPRIGAENLRPCAEADIAATKPSATTNPNLYIFLAIDLGGLKPPNKKDDRRGGLVASFSAMFSCQRNSPFACFYAIRISRAISTSPF